MSIQELYSKLNVFEENQRQEIKARSHCRRGCSQCCYTDIGVFQVEANQIHAWFRSKSPEEQLLLKAQWSEPRMPGACVFLRNESCTIYESRPLICRSQGMALRFEENAQSQVDICPLNDSILEIIKDSEVINLDLLNRILVSIEHQDSGGTARPRKRLAELQLHLLESGD